MKSVDEVVSHSLHPLSHEKVQELAKDPHVFIIDARSAPHFIQGHIPGSVCCPIDAQFAIWSTYISDPRKDEKIILVVPEGREKEAITRLTRTGLDNVVGYVEGGFEKWAQAGLPVTKIDNVQYESKEEFETKIAASRVIDVRNLGEWEDGVHKKSELVTLANIKEAAASSQDAKTAKFHVHCKGGVRSTLACSLLQRYGFTDVHNVAGGSDQMKSKGVEFAPMTQQPKKTL